MNSEVTYLLVEPRRFILIVYNPGHSSGVLRASFFVGFYPLKNRIKIKPTKMFELPRHPFPAGTGFAEYLLPK